MPTLSADELGRLAPPASGTARAVFAADPVGVGGALAALEERAEAEGFRAVAIRYERLPRLASLIDDALERLAELAMAAWPDWPDDDAATAAAWRKAAEPLCERGAPPLPPGWTAADSARRLARAIDAAPLAVALASDDPDPPPGALLGLARVAEWLAREAAARVLVVVSESLAGSDELDAVAFDATYVRARTSKIEDDKSGRPTVRISPRVGRPNPNSGGEMMLAERLERDAELAGMFRYNIPVETARGRRFLVDLVWEAGKVAVEVDGYYYHREESSFINDRERDYHLMISGFLVLRLPEAQVREDIGLAVEKIRDVVAIRRPAPLREERTRR